MQPAGPATPSDNHRILCRASDFDWNTRGSLRVNSAPLIRLTLATAASCWRPLYSPERYAIHKLIVASRRRTDNDGTAKSRKDRAQAATIMEVMIEQRQSEDLADGFMEACDRGTAWQEAIRKSMSQIDDDVREKIQSALASGIRHLERKPAEYGLA
ncbi:GSU2403 family nucleotidyltransferase fold protein [Mesorhizobium sp. YR577]|uniref:GSU2403 family nucleotidyltransferase fold protein n=1 Tax=Mesorhizobium sp. YR577 TaxID=1884373 RepID=UPI000B82CB4C|nr:GSU2403 family nucleotidyltransferase fold protein [Mesorhizobium sp. YR577]